MTDYNKIEESFEQILRELSGSFTKNEVQEVQGFFEHGEYGLALETILDIVVEEDKKITAYGASLACEIACLIGERQSLVLDRIGGRIEDD